MYHALVPTVIQVLALCGVVIWVDLSLNKKYSQYVIGVMFGLITIFVMSGHTIVVEGSLYDFRLITMTMAGFIGGPISAVIAALLSSIYRYNMGGTGLMGGIANIIIFACFGSVLGKHLRRSVRNGKKLLFWFGIGIAMACISLLIIGISSQWMRGSVTVLRVAAVPFLIITPLATTLIFNFYFWAHEFFSKAMMLNTIINKSSIKLMIFNDNGPILVSKNLESQRQSSQKIEELFQLQNIDKTWLNTTKQHQREIVTEDGRYFVGDLSSFQMPSGEFVCVAIVHDLTDRKREQEKLRIAKEKFSKVFQLSPHMMAILKKSDFRYVDVNRRFLEVKGFEYKDVIGKTPIESGVSEREFMEFIKAIEEQGTVQNIECSLDTKYGSTGTAILSAEKIYIDDQECILFAYNDVTEMKRMQTESIEQLTKYLTVVEELSRSNQLIADIINNMPDGFYALDNEWRFTFVNRSAEVLFGKAREELLGKVLWITDPQVRGTLLEISYRKSRSDCIPMTFEHLSKLSKDTWYQITAYPSQFGLSVYYRDITERKLEREKLIKSQEEKISILESMKDCFCAFDVYWQFTYINHAGEIILGKSRDELLGRKMTEIFKVNDITIQQYDKIMKERKAVRFEVLSEALGNKWLEVSGYPIETGITCFFRDITSRKKAEKEMARLDRLNLVGQMAAGIAHEIRNPMTTVRGYLQLLGVKPEYATQRSTFDLMISEVDRANAIITEFLSLAQTKQTELKYQNLNDILSHLYPLLEADTFTQNKQIYFIAGEIPNLEINAKEISQLILNLTRNGLDAMEEGGSLTIKSYVEDAKVVLEISDEGCGIPQENINKLGTPFFTTKDTGTGLGLASCYKIAESHKAKIRIDSSSRGTTISIFFPIPDMKQE
ncbi:MAG: PAS domain S-box protein [Desulfosporosinus sp.]|nr:PAS domain S-box protein [Desulfosporosinus sp.]